MVPVSRSWFTPKQRAELWERWRSGQCVADIARAVHAAGRRQARAAYRPPDAIVQDLETYQLANEQKCTSRSSRGVHRAYSGVTVPFKALK